MKWKRLSLKKNDHRLIFSIIQPTFRYFKFKYSRFVPWLQESYVLLNSQKELRAVSLRTSEPLFVSSYTVSADKIVGGIYDDRLLVKPIPSAICFFLCATSFLRQRRRKTSPKNNDKKPLAMSFIPTAKGFLIWIYLLHNCLSIILYHKTTGLQE